jgi:hypothetical protein
MLLNAKSGFKSALQLSECRSYRGSDLVINLMLSLGPVATALGSDLVANRVLRMEPVATALGSDLVTNRVLSKHYDPTRKFAWGRNWAIAHNFTVALAARNII